MNKTFEPLCAALNLLCYCALFVMSPLDAQEVALVIIDGNAGSPIKVVGDCYRQESPCSTFKIVLSLMGFDVGILNNEYEPLLPYKKEYDAPFEQWRQSQTPKSWIKNSCIWYSQQLTAMLGLNMIQEYLRTFNYGNQDFTGNPGNNDGLMKAWLVSSLKISPFEQVQFIQKLIRRNLPVSCSAQEQTQNLLYIEELSGGWQCYGKGGGGIKQSVSLGWFVGWIFHPEKNKCFVFACFVKSHDERVVVGSKQAMEILMQELLPVAGS